MKKNLKNLYFLKFTNKKSLEMINMATEIISCKNKSLE